MHFLHINSEKEVSQIDKHIKKGDNVFILVYMEGCGPCNATRPEWAKLEYALKDQYAKNDKLVVKFGQIFNELSKNCQTLLKFRKIWSHTPYPLPVKQVWL